MHLSALGTRTLCNTEKLKKFLVLENGRRELICLENQNLGMRMVARHTRRMLSVGRHWSMAMLMCLTVVQSMAAPARASEPVQGSTPTLEADVPLPHAPLLVERWPHRQLIAFWGSVASWRDADPQEIQQELDALRRFTETPAFMRALLKMHAAAMQVQEAKAHAAAQRDDLIWRTIPKLCPYPRANMLQGRMKKPPGHLAQMPHHVAKALRFIFYDDADPLQRRWLLALAASMPLDRITLIYAVGYKSRKDLWEFQVRYEGIPIGVAGDSMAQSMEITHVPAIVDFPDEKTMRIQEGIDIAWLESVEAEIMAGKTPPKLADCNLVPGGAYRVDPDELRLIPVQNPDEASSQALAEMMTQTVEHLLRQSPYLTQQSPASRSPSSAGDNEQSSVSDRRSE
ncbi:MAG: hypothetical protein N3A02_04265 [Rectinema sp.]|nr:hypothetical protein [Rectinema sp.]